MWVFSLFIRGLLLLFIWLLLHSLSTVYIITLYTLYSHSVFRSCTTTSTPPTFLTMLYSLLLNRNFSVLPFALFLAQNTQTYTTDHLYLFPSSVAPCDAFHYKLNHFFFTFERFPKHDFLYVLRRVLCIHASMWGGDRDIEIMMQFRPTSTNRLSIINIHLETFFIGKRHSSLTLC